MARDVASPSPLPLARMVKEWFENLFQSRLVDAASGVADRNSDHATR
jgi:hypothetical protein